MKKKLKDLARLLDGEILGDPELVIKGASPIESAQAGDITFALEPRSVFSADSSKASAVLAPLKTKPKKPAILVANPRLAMAKVLELVAGQRPSSTKGIHKTAVVGKGSSVGKSSSVGAFVSIGDNVEVGNNCTIHPHVTIYDGVKIGNRVIIHAGAVIGVDGYGFAQDQGKHYKIPQLGGVEIEDDVEIYANSCVARATMGNTIIKRGTKIDDLSHVAHNCVIGEDCAITSLVGFAGSVTLGNRVYVGGQAGFQGHINVGENTIVFAKSGATKDVPANSVVSGFPAQDHKKELEMQALIHKLPQFFKKVLDLEKGLKEKP